MKYKDHDYSQCVAHEKVCVDVSTELSARRKHPAGSSSRPVPRSEKLDGAVAASRAVFARFLMSVGMAPGETIYDNRGRGVRDVLTETRS